MYKKICDTCRKGIKDNYVNLNLRSSNLKISLFKMFDICEKCFVTIPKLLKDNVTTKFDDAKR
jgi:hypothetical protein